MRVSTASDQRRIGRATVEARRRQRRRLRPTLLALEDRKLLSTFTVTSTLDDGTAGTLRYEIGQANTTPGANTILFDSTVFNTPQTITLSGTQLELSDTTGTETITGPAAGVTVDGNNASRVFQIDPNVTASISGLTITGGKLDGFDYGAGVYNNGTTTLTNCTISGNSASGNFGNYGGGLCSGSYFYKEAATALINCTVSGNSDGGVSSYWGTTTLINTIVTGNSIGDVSGTVSGTVSGSYNLIGTDGSGGLSNGVDGNIVGVANPGLAPLGSYGGTCQTMALLPGSPAIDAGTSSGAPATDQRGFARVGAVDIGAFESQGFTLTVVAGSTPQSSNIGTPFANPLAVSVTANDLVEPVDGGVVSFVANPVSGATAILSAPSAVIGGGQAAVTAAPNNALGSYSVVASVPGLSPVSFALTNTGPAFTSLIVNTTSGSLFPGAGLLSLPEAVAFANFDSSGISSITFDPTVFATPQTITLTGTQLELSNTTETETITGPAAGVTVDGNNASRVFQIDPNVTASISELTITGGSTTGNGGGLYNDGGNFTLTNCTISGNSAGGPYGNYGGGLATGSYSYQGGTATLTNCTISGNYGGGVSAYFGTSTLSNTIVAGNSGGDVGGSVSGSYNLIGTGGSGGLSNGVDGNIVGVANPGLAPLGSYGGTCQTMALLPGSPAIDAGTSSGAPATDQRGFARVGAVDIGAFESQGFTLTVVAGSTPQSANIGTPFANPLAVTVTANDLVEPVDGGVVSFVANPVSGATAILSAPSAVIGGGQAAVTAAPNNALGSYSVVASATGSSPVSFDLTNTGTPFAALVVNTTSDSLFPGAGLLSLPEAVAFANLDSSGTSSITFDPTVFATPQTITLTGTQVELSNTTETETITGPAAGVTVDGNNASRVFQIDPNVTASISGLTIIGGNAGYNSRGGGLANHGTATLTNCTVSGNSSWFGGGVYNGGTITLINCTVSGNFAMLVGGGLYNHSGSTITVTNSTVSNNSTHGAGGGGLFNNGGTATLTNSTVSNNSGNSSDGALFNLSGTTMTLTNCTVSGNTGTGLVNEGTTTLIGCTFSSNTGGGLTNRGTATLTNCTISGNSSSNGGGGVSARSGSTTTLTDCTVSGNSTFRGGGGLTIQRGGTATLTNCTIGGNSAGTGGGGVYTGGTVTLTNCTVSGNTALGHGGSRGGGGLNNYGTATLANTIVAANASGQRPDVVGVFASHGNNLIGKTDGSSGWTGTDLTGTIASPLNPLLAALGNYGGPTRTMALLPGSPAIDAGNNALIPSGVTTDQRGLPRIVNSVVDIGAFESSGFTIAVTSGSGQSTGVLTAFPAPLVATVTAINASEPVAGGLVTFTPPSSGASATLSGSPAILSAAGTASVTATANGVTGSYAVTATASGITTPASFSLTNQQLIIALDPSASGALTLSGNASINTPGIVYVDSSSSSALSASGNAKVTAGAIDVHGGFVRSGNATLSPAPVTGAPVLAAASLPSPSTTGMTNYGAFSLGGSSSATIQPGLYTSISVSGNARLTMAPGIYIIEGGGFSVAGNARVTGSGVMIVNGGSNYPGTGGTYGSITQGGNSTINLSPLTNGPYAGIVFFQPLDNTKALTVGGNASGITGTIYAPGAALSESSNGALNASLIVDTITISGNGVANGPSKAGPAGVGTVGSLVTTSGGTTATSSSIGAVSVLDQTAPTTIPVKMKIKLTDALGNNVSVSSLPVVSMAAAGSAGALVPQTAPGSSRPDSLFTFDLTHGVNRFSLKARGSRLGA